MVTGTTPAGLIVTLSCLVVVPADESITLTVMIVVPAIVGVPVMTPAVFRLNPAGNGLDPGFRLHVYPGMPPVAVSVKLYGTPTEPAGREAAVTVSGPGDFTRQVVSVKSTVEGPTVTTLPTRRERKRRRSDLNHTERCNASTTDADSEAAIGCGQLEIHSGIIATTRSNPGIGHWLIIGISETARDKDRLLHDVGVPVTKMRHRPFVILIRRSTLECRRAFFFPQSEPLVKKEEGHRGRRRTGEGPNRNANR